jgi:hypothetical protein
MTYFMEEIGQWVKEITVHRYTNGVYEPYTVYEPIDKLS